MSDVQGPAVAAMLEGDPELQRAWNEAAPRRAVAGALAALRRARGLGQSEVARAAGWDQAFVSRLEAGRGSTPSLETVARYVRVCGGTLALDIASAEGEGASVDLSALAPDALPAESGLAPGRRERQRVIDAHRQALPDAPAAVRWPAGIVELKDEPDPVPEPMRHA